MRSIPRQPAMVGLAQMASIAGTQWCSFRRSAVIPCVPSLYDVALYRPDQRARKGTRV